MSRFLMSCTAAGSFLLAGFLFTAPAAAGIISFVSVKGVNTGDCASPATPCQTLQFAMNRTSAGGEIKLIDPGNYFAVTIDRSITISGVDGATILRASVGDAITINAGPVDVVTLQNLTVDGFNEGSTNGVQLNTAGFLTIKHCLIKSFSNAGINLSPTSALKFLIEDTVVTKARVDAIRLSPIGSSASAQGALNRVSAINSQRGMRVLLGATVTASDSVFSGHTSDGVLVGSTNTPGGVLRLTRSTLTNNLKGVRVLAGSVAESTGDNAIRGNSIDVEGTLTNVGTR